MDKKEKILINISNYKVDNPEDYFNLTFKIPFPSNSISPDKIKQSLWHHLTTRDEELDKILLKGIFSVGFDIDVIIDGKFNYTITEKDNDKLYSLNFSETGNFTMPPVDPSILGDYSIDNLNINVLRESIKNIIISEIVRRVIVIYIDDCNRVYKQLEQEGNDNDTNETKIILKKKIKDLENYLKLLENNYYGEA
ncbi:hypothetical protein [Rosettibacter firmus]|uniref:hypothetical protein n=1 Tax=Rosettibacter firmus TaxID=3111522 RepID=UPI00336BF930